MKKYKTIKEKNTKLLRIVALKDIPSSNVKAGDLGGLVESEKNLSQKGNCWIYNNAKVIGNAKVYHDAVVCHESLVFDNAKIYNKARVRGNAFVHGNAKICKNAEIYGRAFVDGDTCIAHAGDHFYFARWACFVFRTKEGKLQIRAHCKTFSKLSEIRAELENYSFTEIEKKAAINIVKTYVKLFKEKESVGRL